MLGEGIIKGLAETARNFLGSYVSKERLTTVQYPEERLPLAEATRDFPFLVYDGNDPEGGSSLRGLPDLREGMSAEVHLHREEQGQEAGPTGKPQFYPAKFDIDVSVCMSCQICVEVCPFEAIKMDTEYELSTDDRFGGLLLDKHQLAKSNEYYHEIHPTDAAKSDEGLAAEQAKAAAKAKPAEAKAAEAAPATAVSAEAPPAEVPAVEK